VSRGWSAPSDRVITCHGLLIWYHQLLDVRSLGEFNGTISKGNNTRLGHIPGQLWKAGSCEAVFGHGSLVAFSGAKLLDQADLRDPITQLMLPVNDVTAVITKSGLKKTSPVVTYCQSGLRAVS
jgi:3-mercaptopyruvate sulfurtransferase SseA